MGMPDLTPVYRRAMARHAVLLTVMVGLALGIEAAPAGGPGQPRKPSTPREVTIDAGPFLEHVRVLSSDAFQGRAPGTKGEEETVAYIARQFRALGLAPAGPGGSYFQPVPLVGIMGALSPLTIRKGSSEQVLQPRTDFVAWTKRAVEATALENSELVFVGYGVDAPEATWDDYKDVDLSGKTMVVLIGDPPVPDPFDSLRLDPKTFGGPAMTYYGRWTYKLDQAAARKAAGVLIVHETGAAGYGFSVVQGRLAELFDLRTPDNNVGRPAVEGWITLDRAKALFALAGQDFEALKRQAATRAFRPVPLGLTASMTIRNTLRPIESRNAVGRLEGSDPKRRGEHVVFTAHWDHLGIGEPIDGETVRHGAVDNATGVAGLLELARVFAKSTVRPPRSLLFLSVTAEEQLMLGSEHYVRNPIVPLEKTLAVLNLEMLNVYGKTADLTVYGLGASDLDDYLREAATAQHRTLQPDPAPEQGWYYRSDHFPFARHGVPALWAGGGDEYIGRPPDHGQRMRSEYVATRYHKPADVVRDEWDLAGAVEDLQVYVAVAAAVTRAEKFPEWKPGAEFKAKRDEMMRQARRP
jgi:Zn-dependent M28 family amino/carboxypeptidase